MSLRDEVSEVRAAGPKKRSLLDEIVEELPEADGAELVDLIADPEVRGVDIWRVLRRRGFDLSETVVREWCRKRRS